MSADRRCPSCKVTELSRYNAEVLCQPCLRTARDATGIVPMWMWDSAPMRQALAGTDPGAFLAVLRGAAGLSQLDMANLVEGWDQSTVSLIERGKRQTLYDVRELLRVADAVGMPREALLPLILGRADVTVESDDGVDFEVGADGVNRRTFTGITAGLLLPAVLPQMRVPARIGVSHVRYLRSCAAQLYSRDQNVGGAALLRQAISQFQRAREMLDEADYSEAIGGELLGVAGDLAICSGWMAFDAGNVPLARRLYGEALFLAGSAGDITLTVHVLTNMSMMSSYVARTSGRRGIAKEALRLADQAADAARHEASPRLHALIAMRRANAASLLGDETGFKGGITRARRELDRGPHDDDPEWIRFVTEAEVLGHEAAGRLNLGQPVKAAKLYREVLADQGLASSREFCGPRRRSVNLWHSPPHCGNGRFPGFAAARAGSQGGRQRGR
jgi:transcriptional regulator with XRE-family HTH domain